MLVANLAIQLDLIERIIWILRVNLRFRQWVLRAQMSIIWDDIGPHE